MWKKLLIVLLLVMIVLVSTVTLWVSSIQDEPPRSYPALVLVPESMDPADNALMTMIEGFLAFALPPGRTHSPYAYTAATPEEERDLEEISGYDMSDPLIRRWALRDQHLQSELGTAMDECVDEATGHLIDVSLAREILRVNAGSLSLMTRAAGMPRARTRFTGPITANIELPECNSFRVAQKMWRLRMKVALHDGDFVEARRSVVTAAHLARILRDSGVTLIEFLVTLAMYDEAYRMFLEIPVKERSTAFVRAVREGFPDRDRIHRMMLDAIRGEFAFVSGTVLDSNDEMKAYLLRHYGVLADVLPADRMIRPNATVAMMAEYYRDSLELHRNNWDEMESDALVERYEMSSSFDSGDVFAWFRGDLTGRMLMRELTAGFSGIRYFERREGLLCRYIVLSLMIHEMETGKTPASLVDLVPGQFKVVPVSFLTGKPITIDPSTRTLKVSVYFDYDTKAPFKY